MQLQLAILHAISTIPRVRLVLDTVIMVAAIRSNPGASHQLLVAGLNDRFTMLVSVPLLIEYEAVMTRPTHLAASRLSITDVGTLLDAVAVIAQPVRLDFLWRPVLNDADDDMVLETAMNGRADAIITFNRRHFTPAMTQFGIDVLIPAEVMDQVESRP